MSAPKKLSNKQQQFINEYFLCGLNATEAYRRVYPKASYNTARANGATLLANTSISEEIQRRMAENTMSAAEVLMRLATIARGQKGEVRDELTALNLLGKAHRLFVDKAEVSGPNNSPLQFQDVTENVAQRLNAIAERLEDKASANLQ